MARYTLSRTAQKDIDRIWLFIARRTGSIETAERVLASLLERIVLLAAHPKSGKRCEEIDASGRCSILGNYLIYYREHRNRIHITHIFHGKRDQVKAWILS